MIRQIIPFFVALFSVVSFAATHVAVLETISEKDIIGRSEKVFLTDKLREKAKIVLPDYMGYVIMTRENINAMLPPGKSVEECEGSCLVETGKNIAADFVAQARIGKFGQQLTLTVELYETAGNNLVGTFTTKQPDADGLLIEIEEKAGPLFKKIVGNIPVATNTLNSEFVDSRDGHKYRTVKIGNQVWMAENLKFIPKDGLFVKKSGCFKNNDENCAKYGRLYIWKAANEVCPIGWHLPNKNEYDTLFNMVGGKTVAGKMLKSKNTWNVVEKGVDAFGFSVMPAGYGGYKGGIGDFTYFWTSSKKNSNDAYSVFFESFSEESNILGTAINIGLYVRCVKN